MTLKPHIFAATVIACISLGASAAISADSIRLNAPQAGASLRAGDIDMTVYYVDHGDHFEVVATYALYNGPYDPARLRMGLSDGDSVSFGLPGQTGYLYRFARNRSSVAVSAEPSHAIAD
ncbi:hypothetical protein Q5Y75_25700 [Ruegeria sp. 2205SS24-7]|uniref:hypothetical protein n=1 Tax=Ruegeria discodermiae TaxID=3064389 RepID=UPI0027412F2D|nr:hypothetical protein [Ruegeria sp. 2205SS24-7]MDP5220586.1 hypothetical protein [Ruegeria sp. 2205SS24-7]